MESMYTYLLILPFFFVFFLFRHLLQNPKIFRTEGHPIEWPVLGMVPSVLANIHRFIDWSANLCLLDPGSTFRVKGPWFSSMELVMTSNPTNIHHILCKHYEDFHKGPRFNDIFDYLGDGIFNADDELWKYQRRTAQLSFMNPRFRPFLAATVKDKVDRALIPVLDYFLENGEVFDLQDIFQRLASDTTYVMLTGHDPKSLCSDLPSHFFCNIAHIGEEVVARRHILPDNIWKLERWLGVGEEGRLKRMIMELDRFIYQYIKKRREEIKSTTKSDRGADIFTLYIEEDYGKPEHGFKSADRFLRDTFLSFLLAGQDTVSAALSWFFWLISKNPRVEAKIKEEIEDVGMDEGKMVYLHAALCEALRLYPPVPNNHRAARGEDTLPTGHRVGPDTTILLCAYAMGRMESLWGKDCMEFKPERWITENGVIRHEPAHKFLAFNAGPRICLGKEMSMMQMKVVASTIIRRKYSFRVVEGHPVEPQLSVVLHMKHGLKVRVSKG